MAGRIIGAPRPKPGPRMPVHRVTTTERQAFTIYSTAVFGQWVHFFGSRSHECIAEKGDCQGCGKSWPRKWKGYLHCYSHEQRRELFLELTSAACEVLFNLIDDQKPLRGVVVRVNKTKGGRYGRYQMEVLSRDVNPDELPAERDPMPVLRFLWNARRSTGQETD